MNSRSLSWVFIGLSITSSWGNGHATSYRALLRSLRQRGHNVLFLECDVPWYAQNRDMPHPEFCRTELYRDLTDLKDRFEQDVQQADVVVVGSYVQDGVNTGKWVQNTASGVVAFYDIDTPVTLAKLRNGDYEYISPSLVPQYHLYLSFSGGRTLETLENEFKSPCARALYCSFDPNLYYPEQRDIEWDLGYLGTYSDDRQPGLENLMLTPARHWPEGRFVVAGPQYPKSVAWPPNVHRIEHLPPAEHRQFYNAQRFTLNVTRSDMKAMGHSPSVRLFEAAACGTPIVSDWWEGLDELFTIGEELLICESPEATLQMLQKLSEDQRESIGLAARKRVLAEHTADHRAEELETYVRELLSEPASIHSGEYAS